MAGEITVTDNMLDSLRATRPWVKFLAILGFIICGLMALVSLAFMGGAGLVKGPMAGYSTGFGIVYLLVVLLYFFPCFYLFKYAAAISRIPASGQAALEEALARQKSFWKFVGILTAVVLVLEVLILVASIAMGVALGSHQP